MRPKTACLYCAASNVALSLSAAFHSFFFLNLLKIAVLFRSFLAAIVTFESENHTLKLICFHQVEWAFEEILLMIDSEGEKICAIQLSIFAIEDTHLQGLA